jgi:hypothetical protein
MRLEPRCRMVLSFVAAGLLRLLLILRRRNCRRISRPGLTKARIEQLAAYLENVAVSRRLTGSRAPVPSGLSRRRRGPAHDHVNSAAYLMRNSHEKRNHTRSRGALRAGAASQLAHVPSSHHAPLKPTALRLQVSRQPLEGCFRPQATRQVHQCHLLSVVQARDRGREGVAVDAPPSVRPKRFLEPDRRVHRTPFAPRPPRSGTRLAARLPRSRTPLAPRLPPSRTPLAPPFADSSTHLSARQAARNHEITPSIAT